MKKISFILMIYSLFALPIWAYSELAATLHHASSGSTSVYYGMNALAQAYNKSVNGDVITLSSGVFTSCDIAKSITIRGAGMQTDSTNNILPTVINGTFEVGDNVTIEGILHRGTLTVGLYGRETVKKVSFIKCCLSDMISSKYNKFIYGESYVDSEADSVSIAQCVIKGDFSVNGKVNFYNSVIHHFLERRKSFFLNCLVHVEMPSSSEFYNSVVISKYALNNTVYLSHCLGVGYDIFRYLEPEIAGLNWTASAPEEVFQDYNADFGVKQSFSLKQTYQYLGTDSTTIGIYGGAAPFTPYTEVPKIKKFHVANKSTAEGKLSVDIEVTTPSNTQ